jgi:hypothetical protein
MKNAISIKAHMVTNGHLHIDEKEFWFEAFLLWLYWFNGVSWSIEENLEQWPQLIHQISQKKFLKLTNKRRHGLSASYSRTVCIDRKISQRLWMFEQQFWTVRCWSMDCPSIDHGLSGRVARTVRMRCVHVRSPRLGHKESSISLLQVWINLDGYFQEIDFSKWTEWIYFVKVLNRVDIKFDSIWRSIAQV